MTKLFSRFLKDESGATAIEYGLIAALISVALIAGATTLGGQASVTRSTILPIRWIQPPQGHAAERYSRKLRYCNNVSGRR